MTDQGAAALDTALAYHRAWTYGDFSMRIVFDSAPFEAARNQRANPVVADAER